MTGKGGVGVGTVRRVSREGWWVEVNKISEESLNFLQLLKR